MRSISTISSVLVLVASAMTVGEPPVAPLLSESDKVLIHSVLRDASDRSSELKDRVIAMGASAVPELERALTDEDTKVRSRALTMLSRIEDGAPAAIARFLRSNDGDMRTEAMYSASSFLNRDEVADAFVAATLAQPLMSNTLSHARRIGTQTDSAAREKLVSRLVPRARESLRDLMDARSRDVDSPASVARELLMILGTLAPPGDNASVDLIRWVVRGAEGRFMTQPADASSPKSMAAKCDAALAAAQFALANLGDADALSELRLATKTGTPEVKLSRWQLVSQMRPVPAVLELVADGLDDVTPLPLSAVPSHAATARWRRACDLAVDILGAWFKDFPIAVGGMGIYDDQQLATARTWLRAKIAESEK